MKKIVLSLALVALMLFGLVAAAEGIVPYGNPDTTLDNPQSLPYSSSFSFKKGSTTNAFKTSSGSITVKLEDAYLTTNRTAKSVSKRITGMEVRGNRRILAVLQSIIPRLIIPLR